MKNIKIFMSIAMAFITLIGSLYQPNSVFAQSSDVAISDSNVAISILETEYGQLNFSNSDELQILCNEDDVCTFLVNPDPNYVLESLTVLQSDGTVIDIQQAENKYSFIVGKLDISIEAVFIENEESINIEENILLETVELEMDTYSTLLVTNYRAANSGISYLGKVTYGGTTVGHFEIDGKIAFCMEHAKTSTPTGIAFRDEIINDGNISKALYYGWQGQGQWSGFVSEAQGIVVTSLAVSHYYCNVPSDVSNMKKTGLDSFIKFIESQSVPNKDISFNPSDVSTFINGDIKQSENITFNGDSKNTVTLNLPNGVILHNLSNGISSEGSVTISGGTVFYLTAPLDMNSKWSAENISGSMLQLNPVMAITDGSYQNLGRLETAVDPVGTTSLYVDWVKTGTLVINKWNNNGELLSGAKFRVQSLSSDINYDETIIIDGTSKLTGLPFGEYKVTELESPNNNGALSGSGYLLDKDNEKLVNIDSDSEIILDIFNDEPTGNIVLTKVDALTGENEQGLATLEGAIYQLYAKDNIYNANGTLLYSAGSEVQSQKSTNENHQIEWTDLPMGKYVVKELSPSVGYNLDKTEHEVSLTFESQTVSVINRKITSYEDVIKGQFKIYKYDEKTGEMVTDAAAIFNIYAAENMNINGDFYSKGQLIEQINTENGIAISSKLPYGKYYISENSAPTKYLKNEKNSDIYFLSYDGEEINYVVKNKPVKGSIKISKIDSETLQSIAQGLATLEGAKYTLYAGEDIVNPATGYVLFSKGEVISVKETGTGKWGDNGTKQTGENHQIEWNNLPLGYYEVKETTSSTGYNLNPTVYSITLSYKDDATEIVTSNINVTEDVIRGDVELSKFGRNSNDSENTEMKPLENIIFSIKSNTNGKTWYLLTNENGYADSQYNDVYSRIIENDDGSIEVDKNSVVENNSRGFFVYDTYTIKELNTPDGYSAIHDITFDLKTQSYKYQWILEDKDIVAAIRVEKKDIETGNVIKVAGTTFEIYDSEMNKISMVVSQYPSLKKIDKFTTDENGSFILPEKLPTGTYYIKEISAPDGYLLGDLIEFSVTDGNDWELPFIISYYNENVKGQITIKKTDSLTNESVENAVYGVYADGDIVTNDKTVRYAAGELVDTITTNKNGYGISKELYLGKYIVKEIETPSGYILDEEIYNVELKYKDDKTAVVFTLLEVKDEPNTIYISKVDGNTEIALKGAKMQLIDTNGKIIDEWITTEKLHEITKLPVGNYVIHEVSAPAGYLLSEDIEITVNGGIENIPFIMKDDPIISTFSKVDCLDNNKNLKGATLQLINANDEIVDEWITDGKEHFIYAIPTGTYTLREVSAPAGYLLSEDIEVNIELTETIQHFVMKDDPIQLEIYKIDGTLKNLKGATLQLINADGEIVDEWVTNNDPHLLYAIPIGIYTLREVSAPAGYEIADDIEVVVVETKEIQKVTMKDLRTGHIITKMFTRPFSNSGISLKLTQAIGKIKAPMTSDDTQFNVYVWMMIIVFILMLIVAHRTKRKKMREKKYSNRKKHSIKRKIIFSFLMIFVMTTVESNDIYAKNRSFTKEYEYTAKDRNEEYRDFETTIEKNNRSYYLADITYDVIETIPNRDIEECTKTVESEYVLTTIQYTPEDYITEDGITYELKDCSVLDGSQYKKIFTSFTDYLDNGSTIPKTKIIGATDENGQNVNITSNLVSTEIISEGEWLDNDILITFDYYDTGVFELQGQTITINSEYPLEGYDKELLESVGADLSTNRVVSTEWSGEPYYVDDVLCRDAVAHIQSYVSYIRANYRGSLDYVKYESTYSGMREVESKTNVNYIIKATAIYEVNNVLSAPQIVVLSGIGVAVIALFAVLILHVLSKRSKKEKMKEEGQLYPVGGF